MRIVFLKKYAGSIGSRKNNDNHSVNVGCALKKKGGLTCARPPRARNETAEGAQRRTFREPEPFRGISNLFGTLASTSRSSSGAIFGGFQPFPDLDAWKSRSMGQLRGFPAFSEAEVPSPSLARKHPFRHSARSTRRKKGFRSACAKSQGRASWRKGWKPPKLARDPPPYRALRSRQSWKVPELAPPDCNRGIGGPTNYSELTPNTGNSASAEKQDSPANYVKLTPCSYDACSCVRSIRRRRSWFFK